MGSKLGFKMGSKNGSKNGVQIGIQKWGLPSLRAATTTNKNEKSPLSVSSGSGCWPLGGTIGGDIENCELEKRNLTAWSPPEGAGGFLATREGWLPAPPDPVDPGPSGLKEDRGSNLSGRPRLRLWGPGLGGRRGGWGAGWGQRQASLGKPPRDSLGEHKSGPFQVWSQLCRRHGITAEFLPAKSFAELAEILNKALVARNPAPRSPPASASASEELQAPGSGFGFGPAAGPEEPSAAEEE